MTIIFMDKKKRDIVFDDTRTREEFFQTVSQIKHIHKSEKDVKTVSVGYLEAFGAVFLSDLGNSLEFWGSDYRSSTFAY